MRLLYVLHQKPDGYPAGIEQYLLDLLSGPLGRRYQCFLVYPNGLELRLRSPGAPEQTFPRHDAGYALRDAVTEGSFLRILDTVAPAVVHFQCLRNLPLSLIETAIEYGSRVVVSVHDYFLWCIHFTLLRPDFCYFEDRPDACHQCLISLGHQVPPDFVTHRREYVGELLARCDRLVFPSSYARSEFLSHYRHLDPARCLVIENGTLARRPPIGPPTPRRGRPLRVAFLGNFLRHKGSDHFRRILHHFRDRAEVEFHVFGNLYESIGVAARNLVLHGGYDRRRVPQLLVDHSIDLVLLLSTMPETFSYTLSEALVAGVPVIATDLGALRQRVAEEAVGFLVEHDDAAPRACRIIEDLLEHPEVLAFFGERARRAADRVPTFDQMVEAHIRLYEGLRAPASP